MKQQRINEILAQIKKVKIAVYGDFCIDAYWLLDPRGSEVSLETGLQARAVGKHYYSLGGASNVVANLAALEPAVIQVIGAVGDDIFGRELRRQFHDMKVDTKFLVVQKENFDTVTFGKPYLEDKELPRIDFGFLNKRTEETDRQLLDGITHALQNADALIVNQQVPGSITNESFIDKANALFEKYTDKQILAVRQLLVYWKSRYGIPLTYNDAMWDVNNDALNGKGGVWTHVSYRSDKSDCHPQPELIAMLKSL